MSRNGPLRASLAVFVALAALPAEAARVAAPRSRPAVRSAPLRVLPLSARPLASSPLPPGLPFSARASALMARPAVAAAASGAGSAGPAAAAARPAPPSRATRTPEGGPLPEPASLDAAASASAGEAVSSATDPRARPSRLIERRVEEARRAWASPSPEAALVDAAAAPRQALDPSVPGSEREDKPGVPNPRAGVAATRAGLMAAWLGLAALAALPQALAGGVAFLALAAVLGPAAMFVVARKAFRRERRPERERVFRRVSGDEQEWISRDMRSLLWGTGLPEPSAYDLNHERIAQAGVSGLRRLKGGYRLTYYAGLLDLSAEQRKAVLAHEIGHVAHDDTAWMAAHLALASLAPAFALSAAAIDPLMGLLAIPFAGAAAGLIGVAFRRAEHHADQYAAWRLGSGRALSEAFDAAEAMAPWLYAGPQGEGWRARLDGWLSSILAAHPPAEERQRRLARLEAEVGAAPVMPRRGWSRPLFAAGFAAALLAAPWLGVGGWDLAAGLLGGAWFGIMPMLRMFASVDEHHSSPARGKGSRPISPEEAALLRAEFEALAREAGLGPPAAYRFEHYDEIGASVTGVRHRYVVSVQGGLLDLGRDQRRAVLAHELGHMVHLDPGGRAILLALAMAAMLALGMPFVAAGQGFWLVPLFFGTIGAALAAFKLDELRADRYSAAALGSARPLREVLLEVERRRKGPRWLKSLADVSLWLLGEHPPSAYRARWLERPAR